MHYFFIILYMNFPIQHPTLSADQLQNKIDKLIQELSQRLFDITEANFLRPNCIDGRDTNDARPSIPGGWLWVLWVILAYINSNGINIDIDRVVDCVKSFFWWTLTWHSDECKNPSHQCQWCGHVDRLINETQRYGVTSASSQIIRQEADNLWDNDRDILIWAHEERNVFIVDIPNKGIIANSSFGQDFVYNLGYAYELYKKLLEHIQSGISLQIDLDIIMQIAENHFMNTGWDLAWGEDVFNVSDIDWNGIPEIKYLMTVPNKIEPQ